MNKNIKEKLIAKRKSYRQSIINKRQKRNTALIDEDITSIFARNDDEEKEVLDSIYLSLANDCCQCDR